MYTIKFIDEYINDKLYQFEVESKGCLLGVMIESNDVFYTVDFYDQIRFMQYVSEELKESDFIYEYNIVILKKVNLENIINAVEQMWLNNTFARMVRN